MRPAAVLALALALCLTISANAQHSSVDHRAAQLQKSRSGLVYWLFYHSNGRFSPLEDFREWNVVLFPCGSAAPLLFFTGGRDEADKPVPFTLAAYSKRSATPDWVVRFVRGRGPNAKGSVLRYFAHEGFKALSIPRRAKAIVTAIEPFAYYNARHGAAGTVHCLLDSSGRLTEDETPMGTSRPYMIITSAERRLIRRSRPKPRTSLKPTKKASCAYVSCGTLRPESIDRTRPLGKVPKPPNPA